MKRTETKVYVKWVIEEIKKDRASFDGFAQGKGIIATREKFLKFLETAQGEEELADVKNGYETGVENGNETDSSTDKFTKTIIVPMAIPGCGVFFIFSFHTFRVLIFFFKTGKTSVSVALAFGHTQSDDVHAKKNAPAFIKNVVDLLHKHNVVIADKYATYLFLHSQFLLIYFYDRCNQLKEHRQSLQVAAKRHFSYPVRLLALNWSLDQPPATIHRICGDRVLQRGDNHQSTWRLVGQVSRRGHLDVYKQYSSARSL